MKTYKILIVEEENNDGQTAFGILREIKTSDFQSVHLKTLDEAQERLRREKFEIILLSLSLPKVSGFYALDYLKKSAAETPVILINGVDDDSFASEAIKRGAAEYLARNQMGVRTLSRAIDMAIARLETSEQPALDSSQKTQTSIQQEVALLKAKADQISQLLKKSNLSPEDAEAVFNSIDDSTEKLAQLSPEKIKMSILERQQNIKFLVVDDDPQITKRLSNRLNRLGFSNVDTAQNGEVAYDKCVTELLRGPGYDIVISDWRMPRMTGIELLEKVRANPKLTDVIFMMVTAVDEVPLVKQALASDVTQYLIKPFKGNDFDQKIASLVQRKLHA